MEQLGQKEEVVVQTFAISAEETEKISLLNSRLVALQNLVRSSIASDDEETYEKLLDKLAKEQQNYEMWFRKQEKKFEIKTSPRRGWIMNFETRILSLVERPD